MMTIKEIIIVGAADELSSSISTIRGEAANVPDKYYLDPDKTVEQNVQALVKNITDMRQAEIDFEKAHPELNP